MKLKWVLAAKYEREAHTIMCELWNQTLYHVFLNLRHNKPDWVKTQHGVSADGIIIDKYLQEEDEGVYRCKHTSEIGLSTNAEYNLTASGKSAQLLHHD